ncbi:hypothetical protein M9H77_30497 [Catharanthus roseus]|uniref:Uncharacterized protein n=1 Tax=Catharanthus roseus TaxID=4058 RepID=A0ACB9ZYG7_CATRO|nr:hypothetical protein M9H77_30497 [Catharanthus roseus]
MLGRHTLVLDPVNRGHSTVGGSGPRQYYDGTIVRGSVGSTASSSYSLREIDSEQPLVAIVDIPDSDFETVDRPVGTKMDIEKDPVPTSVIHASPTGLYEGSTSGLPISSPLAETVGSFFPIPCLSLEQTLQAVESQIAALQVELARMCRCFHSSRQVRQLETARADRLAAKVAQMRGTFEAQHHDTEEHKIRQFVKGLGAELQRALAPLLPMSFATVRDATRTKIANQMAKRRAMVTGAPSPSRKRPVQGCWRLGYPKKSQNDNRMGNGNHRNPVTRSPRPTCT